MSEHEAQNLVVGAERARRSRRAFRYALPALIVFGGGTAVAVGAIPSGDGTITGCYYNGTLTNDGTSSSTIFTKPAGELRVIDTSGTNSNPNRDGGFTEPTNTCAPDESTLTWNQRGRVGPAGPQGSQGPPGAKGDTGSGAPAAGGPTDNRETFIKLDQVSGSSVVKGHKGEIDAQSFAFGVQNSGQPASGGAGASKGSFSTFDFVKSPDASSAALLSAAASGKFLKSAVITVEDPANPGVRTATITLGNVQVASVHQKHTTITSEDVKLRFGKIVVNDLSQAGKLSTGGWDLNTNAKAAASQARSGAGAWSASAAGPDVPPAQEGTSTFVKIASVDGESTNSKHKGEIEVQTFGYGVQNNASSAAFGTGSAAFKARFATFDIAKVFDAASPKLIQDTAAGTHLSKVEVFVTNDKGATTATYTLSDVLVSEVRDVHSTGAPIEEELKLSYAKIQTEYTLFRPDGTSTSVKSGWDVRANRKF